MGSTPYFLFCEYTKHVKRGMAREKPGNAAGASLPTGAQEKAMPVDTA